MKFEDGIYPDMSIEDYHQSDGVSRSSLMLMGRTPFHYWYEKESGQAKPRTATPAMVLGELVHTLCLEPEFYDERFAVAPKVDKRTKAGKEAWFAFDGAIGDATAIKSEDYEIAQAMASSFRADKVCSTLITGAKFENSIFFTHEATGLQCKSRPDVLIGDMVGDLKTTASAGMRDFQTSCHKFGYFLQAAMLKAALKSIGLDMSMFVFLCVEKDSPYAVASYPLSLEALEYGSNLFDTLMFKLKECKDSGLWPSYGTKELCLPSYLKESKE